MSKKRTSTGNAERTPANLLENSLPEFLDNSELEIVAFRVAEQMYGLPIENVVEALRMVAFTRLPTRHTGLLGIINFRGSVIPLISLRQMIGEPQHPIDLNTPIVVASRNGRLVSLLVDEVTEVIHLTGDQHVAATNVMTDTRFVSAVVKLRDGMLLILDLDEIHREYPNSLIEGLPASD